eukprot:1763109-Alexandrium_andersonii.AAC.1
MAAHTRRAVRDFCCKTEIFAVSCATPILRHAAAQVGKRASTSTSACAHAGPAHEATLQWQPTFAAHLATCAAFKTAGKAA